MAKAMTATGQNATGNKSTFKNAGVKKAAPKKKATGKKAGAAVTGESAAAVPGHRVAVFVSDDAEGQRRGTKQITTWHVSVLRARPGAHEPVSLQV